MKITREEAIRAYERYGSYVKAGRALGVSGPAVRYHIALHGLRGRISSNAASRRRRCALLEQGMCADCGLRPLDTIRYCRPCADRHNKRSRERCARAVAAGQCVNCGRPLAIKGHCRGCADRRNTRQRTAKEIRKAKEQTS